MLKYLKLQNVGPAAEMELELGSRLNILTGDNGLGKSFLLDVAWYDASYLWPKEVNPSLNLGFKILPRDQESPSKIYFKREKDFYAVQFNRSLQLWTMNGDATSTNFDNDKPSSISIYIMADGSVAIFDPFRNARDQSMLSTFPPAYIFNPSEVLYGLEKNQKRFCNGLIADWAGWQKEKGEPFDILKRVLASLSPDKDNPIEPGELTRIDLDDVRDIPTIKMPYEGEVAIVHASSGIRRILTFTYLLVWTWVEHNRIGRLRGLKPLENLLFLFDEIDAHLSPSWQRKIVPSMLDVAKALSSDIKIQILATTHSPLIMASLEPIFDSKTDAWFDLDLVGENGHREVKLEKREFEILGDADNWLTSDAFDLETAGSLAAENVLKEAEAAMGAPNFDYEKAKVIYSKLIKVLPADDTYFMRWRVIGKKEGWWK